MDAVIYYFTGTGNSLAVARELAARLNADLRSMKSAVDGTSLEIPRGATLGIVFPVYNHRIPYIVKRFADGLRGVESGYVFAVCTYGDSPCIALPYLSKQLEAAGLRLDAGFSVKMPYNYVSPRDGFSGLFKPFALRTISEEERDRLLTEAASKAERICDAVRVRAKGPIEAEYQRLEGAIDFLNLRETLQKRMWLGIGGFRGKTNLTYLESIQLMDHAFFCDGRCTRCGTCAKVCPVGNIAMTEGGPVWQHHCEQCFACLQWCPMSALQYGSGTTGLPRYHHPDVTLSDMLR